MSGRFDNSAKPPATTSPIVVETLLSRVTACFKRGRTIAETALELRCGQAKVAEACTAFGIPMLDDRDLGPRG